MSLPYISNDILSQILLKLSVKCLLRCRVVCKSWNNLIRRSDFVDSHLEQSTKQVEKVLLSPMVGSRHFNSIDSKSFKKCSMERYEFPSEIRVSSKLLTVFGSCNGLVLLVDCDEKIFLWNPCTGESKKLLCPRTLKYTKKMYGLTYDSENRDYKLAVVSFVDLLTTSFTVSIFSLNQSKWMLFKINNSSYRHCGAYLQTPIVVLNGVLHWLVVGKDKDEDEAYKVLAFNSETQSLNEIELLEHIDSWSGIENSSLGVLGGRLCLFGSTRVDAWNKVHMRIMNMMNNNDEDLWKICFDFTYKEDDSFMGSCVLTSGNDILIELLAKKKLSIRNHGTRKKKEVPMDTDKHTILCAYVESLVSVYGTNIKAASKWTLRSKGKFSKG